MKVKNLYNLKSFESLGAAQASLTKTSFSDSASARFADAESGNLLARTLTYVDPKIFEKRYPELSFISSGIGVNNSGGVAEFIQSLRVRAQGEFRQVGDESSNKGKFSVTAEDSGIQVIEKEAEASWSKTQVQQAALANRNLVNEYFTAFNKRYLEEIDKAGFIGLGKNKGLFTYTGFTVTASAGLFSALTAEQMYNEVRDFINEQWSAVNNTQGYMMEKIVMPLSVLNLLGSVILNTAAGFQSVLLALKGNFPSIAFTASFRAKTDMVGFATSEDAMIMRIPEPLTIGEITTPTSFKFHVEAKYRAAGLDVLEDSAGYRLSGVAV